MRYHYNAHCGCCDRCETPLRLLVVLSYRVVITNNVTIVIIVVVVVVVVVDNTLAPVVAQGKLPQADRQQGGTALLGDAACLGICCTKLTQCSNRVAGEAEILQASQHVQAA